MIVWVDNCLLFEMNRKPFRIIKSETTQRWARQSTLIANIENLELNDLLIQIDVMIHNIMSLSLGTIWIEADWQPIQMIENLWKGRPKGNIQTAETNDLFI